jgi:hypothetical protein
MLATSVRPVGPQAGGVGDRIVAFTGIRTPLGGIGFTDTMVVTEWISGRSVTVAHTGKIVRGWGTFAVTPRSSSASQVSWSEELEIPGGTFGSLAWRAVAPVSRWAVTWSLRRFARQVATAARHPESAAAGTR